MVSFPAGHEDQEFAPLLAALIEGLTDIAVYAVDPYGVIRTWNDGAAAILGYPPEAAITNHVSMLYTKEDRLGGRIVAAQRAMERDGRHEIDCTMVRRGGEAFAAHVVGRPLRRDGELAGYAFLLRDVDDTRRAAHALRDSERRFRLLIEGITDCAIYMLDTAGVVTSWNPGGERITGYGSEEIVGQHFSCVFTEADRSAGKPMLALKSAAEAGRYEEEGPRLRRDGSSFAAHVVIDAIRDVDGHVTGYAKIMRDITSQQAAARALRDSENRFRLMIESVRDCAIYTLDPAGIITSWNVGAQRITGYSTEEALGEHVSIFHTPRDRRAGEPYRAIQIAHDQGSFVEEGQRMRKDGSLFAADVVIHAIRDDRGELTGYAKIIRDASDRKQRERAESASAAKSHFLAQMSHEFRTPLNAIIGFSEIIKTELLGRIGNQRYVSYGDDIHASGLHLLSLVNDLLDLTRIEAGRLELNLEPVDMRAVAAQAIRLFEPTLEARGITIDLNVAGDLSAFIADGRMLRQCVVNLVDNAIKHSPPGSMVRVAIGRLDDRLTLRVIDQGCGIAEGDVAKALEPFGRVPNTMTTPVDGIGLGLPLVKSYCELHGGAIAIRGAAKAGTEVVLSFPYPGPANPRAPATGQRDLPAASRSTPRT